MLILRNIGQLATCAARGRDGLRGAEMADAGVIARALVAVDQGRIVYAGPESGFRGPVPGDAETIDADRRLVTPGFVDSHTHLIFAGSREQEFAQRAAGLSYQEIARRGGGILSTVRAVRAASEDDLVALARPRLSLAARHGTTTIEVKSGYGLTVNDELKMLSAAHRLAAEGPVDLLATFLGAHEIPPEYRGDRAAYVRLHNEEMLPAVARQGIARFGDLFCEAGVFSVDETAEMLDAMVAHGLRPKIHADEFTPLGGAEVAASRGALSADHLQCVTDRGVAALRERSVVATMLPATSFFLGLPYAPARRLIAAGVVVALATDFNPGSAMSYSMPFVLTLAVTQMKFSPAEALVAATINGAAALGLAGEVGSVEVGKQADLLVHDAPNVNYLPYHFGRNPVAVVIKRGRIIASN